MAEKEIMKRVLIAGATTALDYKERHPRATETEVIMHVEKEANRIVREIEENE